MCQQLAEKSFLEGASGQGILIHSCSNGKFYVTGAQKLVDFLLILPQVLLTGTIELKVLITFVDFSFYVIFFLLFFFSSKHKSSI